MEAMSSLEEKEKEMENNNSTHRNWCTDLPTDVLLLIMSKVGAIDILTGAQWVCKNWGKLCREVPSLWRNIDMTSPLDSHHIDLSRMAREAINRARGDIQQFDIRYFADDALLPYLAHSTSLLRGLRLISAYGITEKGLAESVGRFPLLEALDITFISYGKEACKLVGKSCPHLKCFRYDPIFYWRFPYHKSNDEEALGIANYMPNLRHLQIVGCKLTNVGLMAILDKCVHIQSLDIRNCFNITMDASIRARCAQIKDLRL